MPSEHDGAARDMPVPGQAAGGYWRPAVIAMV
jgi:hypothetical protein